MKMYFARIIDENGFFVCDDFVDELTEFTIETLCPQGFYKPKWDGTKWVEGLTQEEIDAIKNVEIEPTETEILKSQVLELQSALAAMSLLTIAALEE